MPPKRVPPPPPGFPALQRRYSVTKPPDESIASSTQNNDGSNSDEDSDWNPIKFGKSVINSLSGSDLSSSEIESSSKKTVRSTSLSEGVVDTVSAVAVGLYDTVVNVANHATESVTEPTREDERLSQILAFESIEKESEQQWFEMLKLITSTPLPEKDTATSTVANEVNFKKQEDTWFKESTNEKEVYKNKDMPSQETDESIRIFESIDISRWKSLQQNDSSDPLHSNMNQLIQQHGIAPKLRRKLWMVWSGSLDMRFHNSSYSENQYSELHSAEESELEKDTFIDLIVKDVERTSKEIPLFRDGDGSTVLVRILTAFARMCPELSYVQGMSSLAAFILISFSGEGRASPFLSDEEEDEEVKDMAKKSTLTPSQLGPSKQEGILIVDSECEVDAFWTFSALISNRLNGYFDEGMSGLLTDTALLQLCLDTSSTTETLSQVLKEVEFDWLIITPDWFLQLFADSCSPPVSLHIWDLLFFKHDKTELKHSQESGSSSGSDSGSSRAVRKSQAGLSSQPSITPSIPVGRVTLIWVVVGLISQSQDQFLEYHQTDKGGLSMQKFCQELKSLLLSVKTLNEFSLNLTDMISHIQALSINQLESSSSSSSISSRRGRGFSKPNVVWNSNRGSLPKNNQKNNGTTNSSGSRGKSPGGGVISRSAARKKAAERAAEDRVVVAAPNNAGFFKMNFM